MKILSNPIDLAKQAAHQKKSDLVLSNRVRQRGRRDFDPKTSDINILIVLSSMTLTLLGKSVALQSKWMKTCFAGPQLFLDKEYIAGSLGISLPYRVSVNEG